MRTSQESSPKQKALVVSFLRYTPNKEDIDILKKPQMRRQLPINSIYINIYTSNKYEYSGTTIYIYIYISCYQIGHLPYMKSWFVVSMYTA